MRSRSTPVAPNAQVLSNDGVRSVWGTPGLKVLTCHFSRKRVCLQTSLETTGFLKHQTFDPREHFVQIVLKRMFGSPIAAL